MNPRLGTVATACMLTAAIPVIPTVAQDLKAGLDAYTLKKKSATEWRLARRLTEISGLAMSPDGRLFGHDDEKAIIFQIDPQGGELVKAWAFGAVTAVDDFEGIAYVDERFYLVSSDGRLYEGREGTDGERVVFNTYGTPVGSYCEIEGLAFEPADRVLLLLCKNPRIDALEDLVAIYRWSLDKRELAADSLRTYRLDDFTDRVGGKRFQPSGIERHPDSGTYFIVAARQEAIAEVTATGDVLRVRELSKDHRQAEGVTFDAAQNLVIADEGAGKRARLTVYAADGGGE